MTSQITIRPITKDDDAAMAKIIRDVLTEHGAARPGTVYYDSTTDALTALFDQPLAGYNVAVQGTAIVGGAGVFPTPALPEGCCELVKLYLLPKARGKGIGKQLIMHCFERARELGFTSIYLETMTELGTAVGLYEKLGFEYLSEPLGASGHFGCQIWMMKYL